MKTLIMAGVIIMAVVYAVAARHDRDYWKERCDQMQHGYYDREAIKLVNDHRRPKRHPGPAVRFYIGGAE